MKWRRDVWQPGWCCVLRIPAGRIVNLWCPWMKPRFILSVNMKSIVPGEKNNKSLPALSLCRIINNNSDKEVDKENGKLSKPGCNQIYRSSRFGYICRQNRSFGIHQFCTSYVALRLPKVHFWKIYKSVWHYFLKYAGSIECNLDETTWTGGRRNQAGAFWDILYLFQEKNFRKSRHWS